LKRDVTPKLSKLRRRITLIRSRRYYPGFFGALLLVLLRVAIGWHFLYEGLDKIRASKSARPFSAEVYLRNSTGPLAPYFRGLVPDMNGLAKLDPDRLKAAWRQDVARIADHYGFDADQRAKAEAALQDSEEYADIWFQDGENAEKIRKYLQQLRQVQATERDPNALSFQRERAWERRRDLDADRRELVQGIDARTGVLHEAVIKLATAEQIANAGPLPKPWTTLDWVNASTMYGLVAMGVCLILGLLTPLAALAGAVFLGQIYLSMPPWPGLPPNPMAEGHYWIVNKNLIEMLACLVLASTPNGLWIGLDALLFGWIGRGRPEETPDAHADHGARAAHSPSQPRSPERGRNR
jgi:uncharacterized membrane protein YphA (DoxX/SURF4 family)